MVSTNVVLKKCNIFDDTQVSRLLLCFFYAFIDGCFSSLEHEGHIMFIIFLILNAKDSEVIIFRPQVFMITAMG